MNKTTFATCDLCHKKIGMLCCDVHNEYYCLNCMVTSQCGRISLMRMRNATRPYFRKVSNALEQKEKLKAVIANAKKVNVQHPTNIYATDFASIFKKLLKKNERFDK